MRPFKGSQNLMSPSVQQETYSPSRTNYQNRAVNASQNSKSMHRARQIVCLHEEFEDLKKKIREVQNKNQKIIENIHRECNFKKKNPQAFDVFVENTEPIVYFEGNPKLQKSEVSGMSVDQSNVSNQSEYQFRQIRNPPQRSTAQRSKHVGQNMFKKNMQYSKQEQKMQQIQKKYQKMARKRFDQHSINSQQIVDEQLEQETAQNRSEMKKPHQTYHHIKSYNNSDKKSATLSPYSASQTHVNHGNLQSSSSQQQQPRTQHYNYSATQIQSQFQLSIYQLQQSLKTQRQKIAYLQQQLKNKQTQILNVKKDYKKIVTQFDNLQMILEDHLDRFMENVVKKGFFDIQKAIKKNQNRLRNISINIKDEYEEHKSSKLIKQHQLRRSNSRSKREHSPVHNTSTQNSTNPLFQSQQHVRIPKPGSSKVTLNCLQLTQVQRDSKSKMGQQSKKNKEFQQIVSKYEQMINAKNSQISKLQAFISTLTKKHEALDKHLGAKEQQLNEIKIKMEQLQRLMSQTYNQVAITGNQPCQKNKKRRFSSAQSNLLEDIYDVSKAHQKQTQYECKYLQLKEQLDQKLSIISQLSTKILNFEKQVRSLQLVRIQKQSNSSALDRLVKQKIQETVRKQLGQLHQVQISRKQDEIRKLQSSAYQVQKRTVQKDCQIISLQSKIKKIQGINQINLKKNQEYEKLLNNYQHNCSVDFEGNQLGAMLLDNSVCNDGQPRSTTGVQFSGVTPNKNVVIPRSQLQGLQTQIQQMSQQILHLTKRLKVSQNSQVEKDCQLRQISQQLQTLLGQRQRLTKQNNSLKSKVCQLEQQNEQTQGHQSSQQEEGLAGQELDIDRSICSDRSSRPSCGNKLKRVLRKQTADGINLFDHQQRQQAQTRNLSDEHEQARKRLQQQIQGLKVKNCQVSRQLSQFKSEHLQLSRSNIALNKDNEYLQDTLSDREQKYERYKRQSEQLKAKLSQMAQALQMKDEQLKRQKSQNCTKIQEIQRQWLQFQEQINRNSNTDNLHSSNGNKNMENSQVLMASSRYNASESSILISSTIRRRNSHYLKEQNQHLTIKLKEAEATIEMHNILEQKVLSEYKANLEKLKIDAKERNKQCDFLRKQIQTIKNAKRRIQVLYQSSKNYMSDSRMSNSNRIEVQQTSQHQNKKPEEQQTINKVQVRNEPIQPRDLIPHQFTSYDNSTISEQLRHQNKEQQRLYPYQRILQLECQLKQSKDINKKLQQMEEELFKQIRLRQEQKDGLVRLVAEKNLVIQQLQEIVQLRNANINNSHLAGNLLQTHMFSSNHNSLNKNKQSQNINLSRRESIHSHLSLRYSAIHHDRNALVGASSNYLNFMGRSQMGAAERLQSQSFQAGSVLDQSYATNISQIFQKQDFPYEKVQLRRKQQIKLFQKTASYIKSLKDSISQKNKKIKLLYKKIDSLKSNHLSKQFQDKYQISTGVNQKDDQVETQFQNVFRDYESVQLQRKKASHSQRYKTLENEWKLALEENNVLANQIQALQEQLQNAEEQENNLLKIKELYKEQIKKLISKNQSQISYYQDLLAKEKRKLQESQSVHNLETLKQLFLKIIDSIISMESDKSRRNREERKKQIEQFFKVFASLSAIDQLRKNKVIQGIRKMTLNAVLVQEGRSSSSNKSKE